MKDLEMVGNLLLLIEEGARAYSQDQLDIEYLARDEAWEKRDDVAKEFTSAIIFISEILKSDLSGTLLRSRLRNQTDFYSLLGAINSLEKAGRLQD